MFRAAQAAIPNKQMRSRRHRIGVRDGKRVPPRGIHKGKRKAHMKQRNVAAELKEAYLARDYESAAR